MAYLLSNQSKANDTADNQTNPQFKGIGSSEKSLEFEVFKIVFESVVALLGVFGNLSVCAVLARNKKNKSSSEFLLRNLAIADLGILLFLFPLAVIKERLPFQWPFGQFSCLYLYPIFETFYGVSVWTIVGIAVERYRHLFDPIKKGRQKSVRNAKRLVAALWIGSFLAFSAPNFNWMFYLDDGKTKLCYLNFGDIRITQAYAILLLLLWYVLPVALIIWTYIAVSKQLHQSNIFLKTMNRSDSFPPDLLPGRPPKYSGTQERRLRQNKRVKKILTPVVVAFAITMMPVNIFRVVIMYSPSVPASTSYPLFIYLVVLCVVINSSINPLIYCFVSRGFRTGILSLVKKRTMRFSITGSGARALRERISWKMRKRNLFSFETEGNLELKTVRSASPHFAGKYDPGSQQTLPD